MLQRNVDNICLTISLADCTRVGDVVVNSGASATAVLCKQLVKVAERNA